MKIREIIENDIVEDISIYKNIYREYINFIKEELQHDYQPGFSFDEFCVLIMENFEGVDDDMREYLDYSSEKTLTKRLMDAILTIAKKDLIENPEAIKIIENYKKEDKWYYGL